MQIKRPVGWISGALVCGLSTLAIADGVQSPAQDKLAAEIQSLKAEVAQLKADQGDSWLNQRRAEEVKALVRDVLSDADTRASMAANGMTAGHNGKNFFLASEDNTFMMNISGHLQVRYVANFRNNNNPPGATATNPNNEIENGFELRRTKVFFDGYIGDPKIMYKVAFVLDRKTDTFYAEDAWAAYQVMDGVTIFAGQFQDRFAREAAMSSKMSQTVDRSAIVNIFANNDNWVQGAGVDWLATDFLKVGVTVNDGFKSGGNIVTSPGFAFYADNVDYAFSGRADLKLAGDFKNAADVESWSNVDGLQAFIGGGAHYESAKSGANANPLSSSFGNYDEMTIFTADALVKYQGLGIMATGFAMYTNGPGPATATGASTNNYGATVQAGYMVIPDVLEPFVRYEYLSADKGITLASGSAHDVHIVTAGANWFIKKHTAKLTVDLVWALNELNPASALGTDLTGVGLLVDDTGKSNQIALRAQFQLLF